MTSSEQPAVVLGANGQDGRLLIRHLLARNYEVIGAGNQPCARDPHPARFLYRKIDLREHDPLRLFLDEVSPSVVFHAAAVHGSASVSSGIAFELRWQDMLSVNTGSVHAVLEHLREKNPQGKLLYLSSGKVFGPAYPAVVSESSPKYRNCLYTITKGAAEDLISYYRIRHQVAASVVFPFPHESELRPPDFFISKIVSTLSSALGGQKYKTSFNELDFFGDWGSADEYMDICVDVAERAIGQDFVLASGKSWHAGELARRIFAQFGLNYGDYIEAAPALKPPAHFDVSTDKLRNAIGRVPKVDLVEYVGELAKQRGQI